MKKAAEYSTGGADRPAPRRGGLDFRDDDGQRILRAPTFPDAKDLNIQTR